MISLVVLAGGLFLCEPYFEKATEMYGYLDCQGERATPPKYLIAHEFTEGGIAAVLDETGWVYINRSGESVIRPKIYDNGPDYFVEGLARYIEDERYGYFDESGAVVIPAQFEYALPFENGRAKVGEQCSRISDGEHTTVNCKKWDYISKP